MKRMSRRLKQAAGALLLAVALFGLMALPGVLFDQDSTVPAAIAQAVVR
jgi:hypothetical protein